MSQLYLKTWNESGGGKCDIPERTGDGDIPDRIGNQDKVSSAGQQKRQMPTIPLLSTPRDYSTKTVFVFGLKIAAAAVGGQWYCLGTLWAGTCELLIPHGE